jgi:hypothetical protein
MTKTAKWKRRAVRIRAGIISLSLLSREATALTLDRPDNDRLEEDGAIPVHALPALQPAQDLDHSAIQFTNCDLCDLPDPSLSPHEDVIGVAHVQHSICRNHDGFAQIGP